MPKYYCDYCDVYLTHDSASVRKTHNTGWKHKMAVRQFYQQFAEDWTQALIDSKVREMEANRAAQGGTPASFLPFPSAPPNATGMLPPPYPMPGMMPGMPHPGAPLMHMPGGPMHGMFPPPGVEHGGPMPFPPFGQPPFHGGPPPGGAPPGGAPGAPTSPPGAKA